MRIYVVFLYQISFRKCTLIITTPQNGYAAFFRVSCSFEHRHLRFDILLTSYYISVFVCVALCRIVLCCVCYIVCVCFFFVTSIHALQRDASNFKVLLPKVKLFTITDYQNKMLKCIVNASWYLRNSDLNRDLGIETVTDIIAKFVKSHEKRLQDHINIEASRLLNVNNTTRRLKWKKPFEPVVR
jgi:hypothetical protein